MAAHSKLILKWNTQHNTPKEHNKNGQLCNVHLLKQSSNLFNAIGLQ